MLYNANLTFYENYAFHTIYRGNRACRWKIQLKVGILTIDGSLINKNAFQ